ISISLCCENNFIRQVGSSCQNFCSSLIPNLGLHLVRFVPEADVSRVKEEDTAADFTSKH
ncbi:hypothetical protein, partial [Pantoea agglomerans]|uniref:hypothetical protein n=1 Tax=Enterobacter agglomerans TaxID=549 RepID=UPI003208509F